VGSGFPSDPRGDKYHPAVSWAPHGSENGVSLSVDFTQSDATHVTAIVPASQVQSPGEFDVQVQIWFKADDDPRAVSNSLKFSVTN
jgi:hypothetical protein